MTSVSLECRQNSFNWHSASMENIFTAAKPFLILSKLLGILPMSVNRKGQAKVDILGIILSILWWSAYCYLISTIRSLSFKHFNTSKILLSAWDFLVNAEYLTYLSLSVYQFFYRENVLKLLNLLHAIDREVWKELTCLNIFPIFLHFNFQAGMACQLFNYKLHRKFAHFILFCIFLDLVLTTCPSFVISFLTGEQFNFEFLETARFISNNIFRAFYVGQFVLIIAAVQVRFRRLNQIISRDSNKFKIEKLYHKLCDIIELINENFTIHFVPIFSILLVILN